ncbi:arsenate reductase ArsC [Thermodesulforhabdus norvegica]|uniref:Arsenate reductase n=1 Tax=Thermodesulforhabdus norvegica TaxID=39841 RepID=A0A1I4VTS7_9BACT|nr:arsenate reductase ArsC [Thermodesulforhabdus norvegica]SFN04406.1 arsenate reductase [Thermodesulforhabdus norvegica]
MNKKRILYLCTGNSCRSQMAEGWTRHLHGDWLEAHSAGVSPHGIDPRAVKVMQEVGIDISGQKSKSIEAVEDLEFDYVITLCDSAKKSCPVFPARTLYVHVPFDDPPVLAMSAESEEEALNHYRRVRDEIGDFVRKLPEFLKSRLHEKTQR